MLRLCWYVMLIAILLFMEVLLADLGLIFPGACALAFYLCVSRGWRIALVSSAVLAISVETLLARHTSALVLLPIVVAAALAWRRWGERRALLLQVLPGTLLGLGYTSLVAIGENLDASQGLLVSTQWLVWTLVGGALSGAIGVPVVFGLADWAAGGLGFERYSTRLVMGGMPTDDR